jgi:Concanavalin A-like lectin/glucanases superfamily
MNAQFNGSPTCFPGTMADANTALANTQVFDGLNTCIAIANNPNLNFGTGYLSLSIKLKTNQTKGTIPILDKRLDESSPDPVTGYHLYTIDGVLGVQLADGLNDAWTNYMSGVFIADGKTHHIAVTISRTQQDGGRFYVDGREVGTRFNPINRSGSLDNNQPLVIGRRSDSPSTPELFQGEIGEVKLFNRVLSAEEVAKLAGVTTPPADVPPNPNDPNWYMQKAGLPTVEEIGAEMWVTACDLQAQQGAVTFNSGSTQTCARQPEPGWVIRDFKTEVVTNLSDRGSYKADILAEGASLAINEQQIGDKWKIAKDLAAKVGTAEVSTKLNFEYERHQQLIRSYQTNKNTFFMSVTANGGLFRKSVIHVKSMILVKRIA